MAHGTSNPATGTNKRGLGKHGAYDPRFVQRGEKINPQSKENFSSSFLIRGVVILNVASGCACESPLTIYPHNAGPATQPPKCGGSSVSFARFRSPYIMRKQLVPDSFRASRVGVTNRGRADISHRCDDDTIDTQILG